MEELANRFLETSLYAAGVIVVYQVWRAIWGRAETDEWGRVNDPNPNRLQIARSLFWFALTAILMYETVDWVVSLL